MHLKTCIFKNIIELLVFCKSEFGGVASIHFPFKSSHIEVTCTINLPGDIVAKQKLLMLSSHRIINKEMENDS